MQLHYTIVLFIVIVPAWHCHVHWRMSFCLSFWIKVHSFHYPNRGDFQLPDWGSLDAPVQHHTMALLGKIRS